MEVTVIKAKKTVEPIDWEILPTGTVVKLENGAVCMVFDGTCVGGGIKLLILEGAYSGDSSVFQQATGYASCPAVEVLGKVTEIIVEEE